MPDLEGVMGTGQFLTLVAKDQIMNKFGPVVNDWPPDNWWTLISTYRCNITMDQLPSLMLHYNVGALEGYEQYFGEIPQENYREIEQTN